MRFRCGYTVPVKGSLQRSERVRPGHAGERSSTSSTSFVAHGSRRTLRSLVAHAHPTLPPFRLCLGARRQTNSIKPRTEAGRHVVPGRHQGSTKQGLRYLERVKGSLERFKSCPRFRERAQATLHTRHTRHGRRAGAALLLDTAHLVERLLRGGEVSKCREAQ